MLLFSPNFGPRTLRGQAGKKGKLCKTVWGACAKGLEKRREENGFPQGNPPKRT